MAPTESSILSSYLLAPASVTTIITSDQFRDLFPRAHQANPQVKLLYRDLQFLRMVDIDVIRENISAECRKGDRQKVEMYRAMHLTSRNHKVEAVDVRETDMDTQLLGSIGNLPRRDNGHTMDSLLEEMEKACWQLEVEADNDELEVEKTFSQVKETVGALSDLRYGKFAKLPGTEDGETERDIIKGLKSLENACYGVRS